MSRTISVANDVIHKLDNFKEFVARSIGKDDPSYSDIIRFLIAKSGIKSQSH